MGGEIIGRVPDVFTKLKEAEEKRDVFKDARDLYFRDLKEAEERLKGAKIDYEIERKNIKSLQRDNNSLSIKLNKQHDLAEAVKELQNSNRDGIANGWEQEDVERHNKAHCVVMAIQILEEATNGK